MITIMIIIDNDNNIDNQNGTVNCIQIKKKILYAFLLPLVSFMICDMTKRYNKLYDDYCAFLKMYMQHRCVNDN